MLKCLTKPIKSGKDFAEKRQFRKETKKEGFQCFKTNAEERAGEFIDIYLELSKFKRLQIKAELKCFTYYISSTLNFFLFINP